MRLRVLLIVSVGLNAMLLCLAFAWRMAAARPVAGRVAPVIRLAAPESKQVPTVIRTNYIAVPQLFSWREVESNDYPIYIKNLRKIGCPEATIRDIIVADVNQLFAKRRATEVLTTSQQWWRSDPDLDVVQNSMDKLHALDAERRKLLTSLLGPNWEANADPLGTINNPISLDGPQFTDLSAEAKQAVRDIEARVRDRTEAYTRERRKDGKPLDPAELARLRQDARADLAKVLNPSQLEEYLLRYSNNADQLRDKLRGFDATPDEFKGLFRATDAIDLQLQALGNATDAASVQQRQDLLKQRDAAVADALGSDRYQFYKVNQDPAFVQSRDLAEQLGASPDTVLPLYQITQAVEQERQRVMSDSSLTPEAQSEQLAAIYQQKLDSLRRILGEDAFKKYQATLNK